jgi:hypothetical protein
MNVVRVVVQVSQQVIVIATVTYSMIVVYVVETIQLVLTAVVL